MTMVDSSMTMTMTMVDSDDDDNGAERPSKYLPAPGDDERREERKSPDAVNKRHAADRNNCRL